MKINHALGVSLFVLLLGACSAPTVVPPPVPVPAPGPVAAPPAPPPPPPLAASSFKDWRDTPQTQGDWSFEPRPQGGVARFVQPAGTLLALTCNRAARTVTLSRTGIADAPLPMTVLTSSETRPLSANPASGAPLPTLDVILPARDSLLDAMAFSRGRFVVEVNGLPTLALPAWAEIGRVIEDCRS